MKKILLTALLTSASFVHAFDMLSVMEKSCFDYGQPAGCYNLANKYYQGKGVEQDYSKAAELYKQACDGSFFKGCMILGALYTEGKGVEQDYSKAAELFIKACDGGETAACDFLNKE